MLPPAKINKVKNDKKRLTLGGSIKDVRGRGGGSQKWTNSDKGRGRGLAKVDVLFTLQVLVSPKKLRTTRPML